MKERMEPVSKIVEQPAEDVWSILCDPGSISFKEKTESGDRNTMGTGMLHQ